METVIGLTKMISLTNIVTVLQNVVDVVTCPISQNVMKDPIFMQDGFLYNSDHIHRWLDEGKYTPLMTREKSFI